MTAHPDIVSGQQQTDVSSALVCELCGLPLVRSSWGSHPRSSDRFCCYGCYLTHRVTGIKGEEGISTLFLARLGLAAFLATNVMTLSWALYGERIPILFPIEKSSYQSFHYLIFLLSVPVYFLIGLPYLKDGFAQMRKGIPGVDSLIALGTTSAFLLSAYSTFTGSSAIYYDTATMVLVLVTFGRYLEANARLRTSAALRGLYAQKNLRIRTIVDGRQESVSPECVSQGALVLVLPAEEIPVDGVIVEGVTSVDESLLTGEPVPRRRTEGDTVLGGSTNIDGSILVRASNAAENSLLARLTRMTAEVLRTRSHLQLIADRITRVFVPGVIVLALAAGIAWGITHGLPAGLMNGLSILLIACPCALGIGSTLAGSVGYTAAARRGVLLRSFSALELAGTIDSVCFDKTGTLTEGKLEVERFTVLGRSPFTERFLLSVAAALEARSEHPAANAIISYGKRKGVDPCEVVGARTLPGEGIEGLVRWDTLELFNVRIARQINGVKNNEVNMLTHDCSISYIWIDEQESAYFAFSDRIRPSAPESIRQLAQIGVATSVLSGDGEKAVAAVNAQLGNTSHAYAGLLPAEKIERIRKLASEGARVAMVGDGINDAPALAASHLGIALRSGTDLSRIAADATIMDDDLTKVPWLVAFGGRVRRTIVWNFTWAFIYNVIGVGLAAAGVLQPILAAAAMVVSSLMVIINSSRLSAGK